MEPARGEVGETEADEDPVERLVDPADLVGEADLGVGPVGRVLRGHAAHEHRGEGALQPDGDDGAGVVHEILDGRDHCVPRDVAQADRAGGVEGGHDDEGRAGLQGHDLGDTAPVHPPGLAVDDHQLAVEPVDRAEAVIATGERLAEGRDPVEAAIEQHVRQLELVGDVRRRALPRVEAVGAAQGGRRDEGGIEGHPRILACPGLAPARRGYARSMSDQTPPTPDADPTAAIPPAAAEIARRGACRPWRPPPPSPPPRPSGPPRATRRRPPRQRRPPTRPRRRPPPPTYPAAPAYPAAYPPPGYAAAPAAPQTSSNAIIALILAIVSWAVCPIIPAIVALVLASSAAKEIEASGGRTQGAGLVTASRIVSWVNIGLWAAILVVGAFFVVLAIVAGRDERDQILTNRAFPRSASVRQDPVLTRLTTDR